ncbi:MAG: holo-ACP synthase [Clostridia bacterium]|nr:holo-ACP synthase [Clostridia bacterium]
MDIKIGIDSVEISRIEKSIQSESFVKRVFGGEELAELEARNMPPESAAACFCAKEAFSKAIGTGVRGFELKEVQVLHNDMGKPYLVFGGDAKKIVNELGYGFDISITHTDTAATAVVIAFKQEG